MSRYEKEHESIRKSIDDIAGQIDNYVKAFSSEETLNKEIRYYRKCKRVCRFIGHNKHRAWCLYEGESGVNLNIIQVLKI